MSRSRADETRGRRLVVLAATALVLVVGTASAFAVRFALGVDRPDLPPVAAIPSKPAAGKLVLTYSGRPGGQLFFYADGRVIRRSTRRLAGIRTGAVEQRLTTEGVERLRQMVLSSGLFARDRYLDAPGLFWGAIQARTGSRLVTVGWCCYPDPAVTLPARKVATKAQVETIRRLSSLLADPTSGLPRSAWKDPKLRAYVPSRYAICGGLEDPPRLALLPAAARELLRGKTRTYDRVGGSSTGVKPPSFACPELTTRKARALEEILSASGFERSGASGLAWAQAGADGDPSSALSLSLWPILPHGQPLGLMGG